MPSLMDVRTVDSRLVDYSNSERTRVTRRRERIGLSISDLADLAKVSRDTLSDLEAGKKGYRNTTMSKVLSTLDKLEVEMGLDDLPEGARYFGDPGDGFVEFTVEGSGGARAIVKGPIRDLDALQAAALNLIKGITESSKRDPLE